MSTRRPEAARPERHMAAAAPLLLLVACASLPPAKPAPGPAIRAEGRQGAARAPRNPVDWGQVSFTVAWPQAARQLAYIHPDTITISLDAFDAGGAELKTSTGVKVAGTLEKPVPPATESTLTFTEVPSGSARFVAVAKNGAGTELATGSTTVAVEGNAETEAAIVLGLPGRPRIYSFSPTSGGVGTTVTVLGDNLDANVTGGYPGFKVIAKVNQQTAVGSALSSQRMTFQVPAGAMPGKITVGWTADGVTETVDSTESFNVTGSM
ncbi:MAG: IPT/TIG domain-containing protein [Candidatus Sericytochromatia bacterium]|nr:IPT/TIG domain-containing protein [Candidatus Tanganyikabacteria bacterium]